ncbi:MAG: flagellar export protein FliJ [Pantoea agglomerans]
MNRTAATIKVLDQLRQMRERAKDEAQGKLSQQQQLCQRYSNNINALTALSHGVEQLSSGVTQMSNQARFKANIQRVIDWQKQEQALATMTQEALQLELVEQACREKILSIVMTQQQADLQQHQQRKEQQQTDAQAMQSWLRARRAGQPST